MKLVTKIIWGILFVVVFGLALKNMHEATLLLFLGYEINSPLALVLFAFLLTGFVFGVLAMTPAFFRYRRDLAKCRKTIEAMNKESEAQQLARTQPPLPETIIGA